MAMMETLATLHDRLVLDFPRQAGGFSPDIEKANEVLLSFRAQDSERQRAMDLWLSSRYAQPCVFGKIAAGQHKMFYCFLTAEDIRQSDHHVHSKVSAARKLWKHRALDDTALGVTPEHGFMLVVCERTVAYAAADENLEAFSLHLQRLVGWPERAGERGNAIADEWLYLRNPATKEIVKFTFSVDYFASAADCQWWHDHRVPGGIAFTANSLGHMARYLEWYGGKTRRTEWALLHAMRTIDSAAKEHPHCPATYLLNLENGEPIQQFTWRGESPLPLALEHQGKDCGSYKGHLHTDHSIRNEFFRSSNCPAHKSDPYHMDFAYIFDRDADDNLEFMVGEKVTEDEVAADIGVIDDVQLVAAFDEYDLASRPAGVGAGIEAALAELQREALSADEIEELLR
jgi:hypothetical protein